MEKKNEIGYLTVNVRYAAGASPVGGATVVLTKGEHELYEYLTDDGGKTEPIPLAVGDDYGISVYADGFVEAECNDIPIIGGITTLQNVLMFPMPPAMEEGEDEN